MAILKLKDGILYSKWYYTILLIVFASLVIGFVFSMVLKLDFSIINILLRSVFCTFTLWMGCVAIVTFSWKKFPWETMPNKHIIIEVLLIFLLLTLYFYFIASVFSYFNKSSIQLELQTRIGEIVITALITALITTIHEAVFFYRQWKLNFSKSISLEKDNLEARYNALKAQVNPHFLFNSLNSLMSLLDNNPKAEKYVQDLSEYLRYVLLSNSKEEVTLQEELENLEKFFHLQKLRFDANLTVEINIQPTSLLLHIPPLALQMLVDNSIKHNIISTKNPLYIKIFDNGKTITVVNNLQPKQTVESTGQGLKNIEGRYRFISNEPIKIVKDEKQFSVTIPLIKAP
ncbi:MAG: sensor histidine kinase [Paludibacter sp.]